MRTNRSLPAAGLALGLVLSALAFASPSERGEAEGARPLTLAVIGDWPYNQNLLDNAPLLVGSVNRDPEVAALIHVGDIHSGSQPCTSAGILPPIAASNPGWNQKIRYWFDQFRVPVIYTPGDNEWTDCHKKKQFSSGDPLKELASVRELFFSRPGVTLGARAERVATQARDYDRAYPQDAQFVENVRFETSRVVFVTVNVPGSNNDTLPWTSFANPAAQATEVAERTAADLRWLEAAFDRASEEHARAVVIALQADMWDTSALAAGGDGLDQYTPIVQKIADLALRFGKPVLLLNGDSHLYGADRPLADPQSTLGRIHRTRAVPNLTRITVQGSTNAPAEWLRLTIDPRSPQVFSWSNVAYCANPTGLCQ